MFQRSLLPFVSILIFSSNSFAQQPAYLISDIDVKIFIRQMNNIEQCIYPSLGQEEYRKIYQNWPLEDRAAMQYYQNIMLSGLIGAENFQRFRNDELSTQIFHQKIELFNHQNANVSQERCTEFRKEYAQIRTKVQQKIKQGQKN